MALGGSTNAIIHLVAIAGRLGIALPLSKFDEISRTVPVLANVKASGKFLEVTGRCTSSTFSRRTRVATSISSSAATTVTILAPCESSLIRHFKDC